MQELFSSDFGETLLRFLLCLSVNWGIVNFLYYKKSRRRDFRFTFMLIKKLATISGTFWMVRIQVKIWVNPMMIMTEEEEIRVFFRAAHTFFHFSSRYRRNPTSVL